MKIYLDNKGASNELCHGYYSCLNSSVGERPAPRGGTTRPDERQNYNNLNRSPNLMASCCEIVAQFANGIVHFFRMLRYAR